MQQQLTNTEYHARPELSASQVKLLLDNPYKFLNNIPIHQTPDMLLGSVIHKLILESEDFDDEYSVLPPLDARTKEGKAIKVKFEEAAKATEKTLITNTMFETAHHAAEAVLMSKAGKLLRNGQAEQSYFAELEGVKVRCRPDYYLASRKTIIDIKKCADASLDGFTQANIKYKYYIQASFYRDLMEAIGKPIDHFIFVCIETKSPFMVGIYKLSETTLEYGQKKYKDAIEILKRISHFDQPVYRNTYNENFIQTVELPNWVYHRDQNLMEVNYV